MKGHLRKKKNNNLFSHAQSFFELTPNEHCAVLSKQIPKYIFFPEHSIFSKNIQHTFIVILLMLFFMVTIPGKHSHKWKENINIQFLSSSLAASPQTV